MGPSTKVRTGLVAGLAGLAAVVGGVSIASATDTTPAAQSSPAAVQGAAPAAIADEVQPAAQAPARGDCPKDGQGGAAAQPDATTPAPATPAPQL